MRLPAECLEQRSVARDRLDTPCLVVDRDALERNVRRMAGLCRDRGVALRPHGKVHKCAEIGRLQLAAGAVGLCVATVGEAETFAAQGMRDLHLTSTVAGAEKIDRLVALARVGCRISCVVDDPTIVDRFAAAAAAQDVTLPLLVDLDMGRRRAGVTSVAEAADLAARIVSHRGLHLDGIQAYAGHLSHMKEFARRHEETARLGRLVRATRDRLAGIAGTPLRVTGGSTGAVINDLDGGIYTELQCGSYVFMDTEYDPVDLDGKGSRLFEPSLFLQSSVISGRHPGIVTTDGGEKRLASKYGVPPRIVRGAPSGAVYRAVSDEHGQIDLPGGETLGLDTRVECIVPHCDPTVNLFDRLHVVSGERLLAVWPVEARGR